MRLRVWILMLALAWPISARADQPPAAAKAESPETKKPVWVGPTTVTVIDEQESVDDIISRVKRARQERAIGAAGTTPPAARPVEQAAAREPLKTKLREARDQDRASRKEKRQRVQRLRENLRERRANRIRGAQAE